MKAATHAYGSITRRGLAQGLLATLFATSLAADATGEEKSVAGAVVRISRGSFPPEKYETIRSRLDQAQHSLIPAIRRLTGCLHYFAAIDRASGSMVNVSVWRSLADAQQMQTLGPMLALAEEFTREGVQFERPIVNYETLWQI